MLRTVENMELLKVIASNKGAEKICFAGHMYTKKHEGNTSVTWRCTKRSSTKCLGTLKTSLDFKNPVEIGYHCHERSDDVVKLTEVKEQMKLKAQTSLDNPNQVSH